MAASEKVKEKEGPGGGRELKCRHEENNLEKKKNEARRIRRERSSRSSII